MTVNGNPRLDFSTAPSYRQYGFETTVVVPFVEGTPSPGCSIWKLAVFRSRTTIWTRRFTKTLSVGPDFARCAGTHPNCSAPRANGYGILEHLPPAFSDRVYRVREVNAESPGPDSRPALATRIVHRLRLLGYRFAVGVGGRIITRRLHGLLDRRRGRAAGPTSFSTLFDFISRSQPANINAAATLPIAISENWRFILVTFRERKKRDIRQANTPNRGFVTRSDRPTSQICSNKTSNSTMTNASPTPPEG